MVVKLLFKSLLIVCLVIAIASYATYLKTGQFWVPSFSTSNIKIPSVISSPKMNTLPKLSELESSNQKTYKWLANGQWHYGEAPPEGVKAVLISDDYNKTNL